MADHVDTRHLTRDHWENLNLAWCLRCRESRVQAQFRVTRDGVPTLVNVQCPRCSARWRRLLVGQAPKYLRVGVHLTDGSDDFTITDEVTRADGRWFRAMNPLTNAVAGPFPAEAFYPLAFVSQPHLRRPTG